MAGLNTHLREESNMHRLHRLTKCAVAVTLTVGLGALGSACLTRPAASNNPSLKTNFTTTVRSQVVDKVDLLFVIDNSQSMGDKQGLLAEAVPDLVKRLVQPLCVDPTTRAPLSSGGTLLQANGDGVCSEGVPEFPAVIDMHIGIVSSALGTPGSKTCSDGTGNNNDHARLLNRKLGGGSVGEASPDNFLAWFPPTKNQGKPSPSVTAIADAARLGTLFADLVKGTGEDGCGFEAQLESMYRFLVEPNPYESVKVEGGVVVLEGTDNTILQQRAAFLRKDSLVAVIMLTDENESTYDPLQFQGTANRFVQTQQYRATPECETSPTSAACQSCYFVKDAANKCTVAPGQPEQGGVPLYTEAEDPQNVRFFQPKRRFGIDPMFPVQRYADGLKRTKILDRDGKSCTNPLYAAALPTGSDQELCNLPVGPRSPELVFLAVIGGVPYQLLLDGNGKFRDDFTPSQIEAIIGKDPLNYDFTGADPHMLESITPRAGLAGPGDSNTADPYHGRDWDTPGDDLQYACAFDLPSTRNCAAAGSGTYCDCRAGSKSPLCEGTNQKRGKAYPTIREFAVIKQLGNQGILSSLCPREVKDKNSEDYGYRPAVRTIVNKLARQLNSQCLPQPLSVSSIPQKDGTTVDGVHCLILETLPNPGDTCDAGAGLSKPDAEVLKKFVEQEVAAWKAGGGASSGLPDPTTLTVCELTQLKANENCQSTDQGSAGWCYLTGTSAGDCAQSILLPKKLAKDVKVSLQCVEERAGATGTEQK